MAGLITDKNGMRRILFYAKVNGRNERKKIHLRCSGRHAPIDIHCV